MTLASGADLKIGAHEVVLAKDQPNHCVHRFERLFANRTDISGSFGGVTLRPEHLLWTFTDWSGGEGQKYYDPNRPTTYYKGLANPRIPGELQPPPDRVGSNLTTAATPNKIIFAAADGKLYCATGNEPQAGGTQHVRSSPDAVTWTNRDMGYTTGDVLTAMCSDGSYLYVAAETAAGVRKIRRYNAAADSNATFVANTAAGSAAYLGLAFGPFAAAGYVYGWTGKRLLRMDTTAALPVAADPVYTSGVETVPTSARGDVIRAANRIIFFYSAEGESFIMEHGIGAHSGAKPFWEVPRGFVIRQITYNMGAVWIIGDITGRKQLYAVNPTTRQEIFLGEVRPSSSLTAADLSAGFGDELLLLSAGGHFFSYSIRKDALSEIDDLSAISGTFAATTTFKGKRIVGKYNGTTTTVYNWGFDDQFLSSTVGANATMPAWDFGLPEHDKVLLGFHVLTSPLSNYNKVRISYDIDEAGDFTFLKWLRSGKNNYQALCTPESFRMLRPTFETYGDARILRITAYCALLDYSEVWDVIVDLRRENWPKTLQASKHPDQLRWALMKLAENKAAVDFRYGAAFQKSSDFAWDGTTTQQIPSSGYRAYSVLIEAPTDTVTEHGESLLSLRLRNLAP